MDTLVLLTGHTEPVTSIAFSPDGKILASASYDNTIRFWDPHTGEPKAILTGRTKYIAFSPDGATLASGDVQVQLWDTHTPKLKDSLTGHSGTGTSVTFSPDGKTLACVSSSKIHLWDAHTKQRRAILTGHQYLGRPVAFSPDSTLLASVGSRDKTVRLWDAHTGQHKISLVGHAKSINSVAFSPDGETLASGSYDRTIRMWNVKTAELKATLTKHKDSASVLAFSPDGKTLTSGGRDGTIQAWDPETGQHKTTFTHTPLISKLSPDGKTFATITTRNDKEIRLWDIDTGKPKATLIGHTKSISALSFSPDGTTLRSRCPEGVLLWDIRTGKHLRTLTDYTDEISSTTTNVRSKALSPDNETLALVKTDGKIELWNTSTGKRQTTLTKHTDWVSAIAFSPDGNTLASASRSGTTYLWDVVSGKCKATLKKHLLNGAEVLAFSPDGRTLARGDFFCKVDFWCLDSGTYTPTFGHPLRRLSSGLSSVFALAFSNDGTTLASGSSDNTIRLWDAATGEYKETLTGHTSAVTRLVFSNTDTTLVSKSGDGTVLLWNLMPSVETNARIGITPSPMLSPAAGEYLTFNIDMTGGQNVVGYQISLEFDPTALRYVSSKNGMSLSDDASFDAKVSKIVKTENFRNTFVPNRVKLISTTSAGFNDSDGTLATVTFEVVTAKASTVKLSKVRLEKSDSSFARPIVVNGSVVEPRQTAQAKKDYAHTQFALPEGAVARLGKGKVNDIKYSPDKTLLAVAGSIGIWLYDANTGDELALLTGHTTPVTAIAFSPNGDKLVSGSYDQKLRLWNPYTSELLKTLNTDGRIATVAFSPDGRTLANGVGANIQLWDIDTGQHQTTIYGRGSSIFFLLFSPDGQILASASLSDTIELWDPRTGQHIHTLHGGSGTITSIRFSPSGPRLAFSSDGELLASTAREMSGGVNEKIGLWNTRTGELHATFVENEQRSAHPVSTVQFSSDGTTLISGSQDGTVRIWDLKTGESRKPFGNAVYGVFLVPPFLPDSTTLVRVTPDNTIHLWDTKTGETCLTLAGHTKAITSVAFSVDGKTLASASDGDAFYDSKIQLWDIQTRQHKASLEGHRSHVSSVSFLPDGETLASVGADGNVLLWDVQTQQHKSTLTGIGGRIFTSSPDGHTFASAREHSIRVSNAHTGDHKMTLWGHINDVSAIAFSPDGATLASGTKFSYRSAENSNMTVRLWDIKTGKQRAVFTGDQNSVSSVGFSPDGKTLASSSGVSIQLWEVSTGKHKTTLNAYPDKERIYDLSILTIAFSPDGTKLISTGEDRNMHIWDVETGAYRTIPTGHTLAVNSLAFSPDGMTLVSGSLDGTMLLWKMASAPPARLNITPSSIEAPPSGKQLTFNIDLTGAQNVTEYQLTLQYDATELRYISSMNSSQRINSLFATPLVKENSVTLSERVPDGSNINDGILATVTFEVIKRTDVNLVISQALLTHNGGERSYPLVGRAWVIEPPRIPEDVNHDWQVDAADLEAVSLRLGQTGKGDSADVNDDGVIDIADLVLVTKALSNSTPTPPKD